MGIKHQEISVRLHDAVMPYKLQLTSLKRKFFYKKNYRILINDTQSAFHNAVRKKSRMKMMIIIEKAL